MASLTFAGGLVLGMASSLHCAGMCGGVGSALALTFAPQGGALDRLKVVLVAQTGKMVSYATAGAVLGASGAALYGLFDHHDAYAMLQRVGALVLIWTALSLVGLAPSPSIIARLFAPLQRWAWSRRFAGPGLGAALAGLVWGLLPCGMVYAALLYAMLSGSLLHGAMVMTGFALGVSPLLTLSSMGGSQIARFNRLPTLRWAACIALIAFSIATLIWPSGGPLGLCA